MGNEVYENNTGRSMNNSEGSLHLGSSGFEKQYSQNFNGKVAVSEFLHYSAEGKKNFLDPIFIGYETWAFYFKPETKQLSCE
ncbi:hypothetical protein NPIL_687771 [Nephila pilipes]|uniref:Uncharacterized protein n=1 Tax=Nephila pilipes TaxID=299642 RepID=A0A8X6TJD3_NEPPI|nr:hypothetical protein NPIL_687771 [Nephila pilipes]